MKIVATFIALVAVVPLACKERGAVDTTNVSKDTVNYSADTVRQQKSFSRIKGPEGELYVDDGGTGGLPVLFAHSFAGKSNQWKDQLEHLRTSRRAVAFDFRGHGQSDSTANNNFNMPAMAEDIAAVADSLKLDKFVLVGHSMGGSVAIEYASRHPERVAALVMVGTPGKTPPDQAKKIIASLESDAYQQVMDDYMRQLLVNAKPEVNLLVMKDMKMIPKETSLSVIKTLFAYDPVTTLNKYTGPKLIILTTREQQQQQSIQKFAPGVPVKVIDGTSHWVQMDKPQEFNQVLDEFLHTIK